MKKNYWIIVIVVVMVLGLAGGFFYWKSLTHPRLIDNGPLIISSHDSSPTSSSVATNQKMEVKIFMVAVDDNGASGTKIGCGDSAVSVIREVPQTQAVLKAAMKQLISVKDKYYGQSGLYNPLYQSDLSLESVAIDNGKATIKFTGTLTLSGTCEDPRIEAQFMQTALQFPTVSKAEIFINGRNLKDILSQKD